MPESECNWQYYVNHGYEKIGEGVANWQYYVNHGYEKIGEGVAPEFSTDKEDYTYYMFRKRIL